MTNKQRLLIAVLSLLCLHAGGVARAAEGYPEWSYSGRAFADLYLPTRDKPETFQQLSSHLWLQGDARFSESLSARAIYQGDFFEGRNSRLHGDRTGTHLRSRPREAYVEYFAGGLQVRAGKQIIAWGKSDGINPTDFLSAKQTIQLNHDSEVLRDAGVALLVSLTPEAGASKWNYTLVAQPWFPTADYLIPPSALPAGVTVLRRERPQTRLENTEVAGKVAYTGEGWDASLSAFRGWEHRPELAPTAITVLSPTLTAVTVQGRFHRLKAIGADASLASGDMVYRLETAYKVTENDDGLNPLITPTHWDAVVGAERPFLEDFRAQAQFVSRWFPRWTDPSATPGGNAIAAAVNRQVAAGNALLQRYQAKWEAATTLRVSYDHEPSSFAAEALWYQGLTHGDYYLTPLVSYGLLESLRVYLGYDHYGGPADKSLGSQQTYNAVFTELLYKF